jgi:hypothetical protein
MGALMMSRQKHSQPVAAIFELRRVQGRSENQLNHQCKLLPVRQGK